MSKSSQLTVFDCDAIFVRRRKKETKVHLAVGKIVCLWRSFWAHAAEKKNTMQQVHDAQTLEKKRVNVSTSCWYIKFCSSGILHFVFV